MQESSLSITDFLRTVIHLPRKGHLAADDDQGADFPGVAKVEDVDDAKEDLKEDGSRGGDEVHRLSPKVVDVLCNQQGGNKPETLKWSQTINCSSAFSKVQKCVRKILKGNYLTNAMMTADQ